MPIWKEQTPVRKEPMPMTPEAPPARPSMTGHEAMAGEAARRPAARDGKESLIASDLTIEGKIEGSGHVRIAGKFKGDVNVQGNVTIEAGAKLTGGVRANTVTIAGELEGNIEAASRVELVETGVLNGDVKAGSLIVAAGSRMRGQVEFGWEEKGAPRA
ncbi:MAG: polymer-forming cytoskeletal protein [Gemmatimonadota bacterium]